MNHPTNDREISCSGDSEDLSNNSVGSRPKGLELDLRLREFEISQLTQRNNFFMIFQGVLIAGLIQSQGTSAPIITFSMSLLGLATSALQIGMAGGAKYWQSRWEASTRSSEIAIALELTKRKKLAVLTFTHEHSLLTEDEREQIAKWNDENPFEKIPDSSGHIDAIVKADITPRSNKKWFRNAMDWWVRKLAIEPKWSVSRIPIWVGGALLLFWAIIAAHCIRLPAFEFQSHFFNWIELVPLKFDAKTK